VQRFAFICLVLFTAACGVISFDVEIKDALIVESTQFDSSANLYRKYDQIIELRIRLSDVKSIASREVYPYINVFDCENDENTFPVFPFYEKIPMDEFRSLERELSSSDNTEYIKIFGGIDKSFTDGIEEICVNASGGSYIGYMMKSNELKIKRES